MRKVARLALLAAAFACTSLRSSASDAVSPSVAWSWLWQQGLRGAAAARANLGNAPRPLLFETSPAAPLVGSRLQLALLVRTRGGTAPVFGGDLRSAVDLVNLRRSTRGMLVDQLTLAGGRVQPFVQLGLGQWRKDTDLKIVRDVWYGMQVGAGLQIPITDAWGLALQADRAFVRNFAAPEEGFRRVDSLLLAVRFRLF